MLPTIWPAMAIGQQQLGHTTGHHILLIFLLFLFFMFSGVTSVSDQKITSSLSSKHLTLPEIDYPDPDVMAHFNEPYDFRMKEKLFIDVIGTSPSSLHVKWSLTNTSFADSVIEATVICETETGTFVSDKVNAPSDSFTFEFLKSNTKYIVCVYMLEQSASTDTKYLHYTCRPASTIPVVRYDSIVGVVLALGYLILMGGIGYVTWMTKKRRARRNEEDRKMITDDVDEFEVMDSGHQNQFHADAHGMDAGPSYAGMDANNGPTTSKSKGAKGPGLACCTNSHVKFPEDETIQLSATGREISF